MRNFFSLVFGLAAVVAIILLLALILESYITSEEITININKMEKVKTDDGEVYFLVHTQNEIFENRDNIFHRKDDTILIYKKLRKNNKFRVKVVGYNFGKKMPFFLEHRNIVAVIDGPEIIKGKIK